jgi:hypothetical protein
MNELIRYRGKLFGQKEIDEIREIISNNQGKDRTFISREICRRWNWRQINGVLKDIICRGLLLHLESKGLIRLPPRRHPPARYSTAQKRPEKVEIDESPIECNLSELRPIELIQVRRTPMESLYKSLIEHYHYLGFSRPVGEHLEYLAFARGRVIACSGWSSAPRHIGCRDRYIGWNKEQRTRNLHLIVINTRFLILPWVRVRNLASHLLGMLAQRVPEDWQKIYKHDVVWLETFVDPERGFSGACYKAANWIYLGKTTGRGKDDNTKRPNRSMKYIFGYPLRKDFKEVLCD